MKKQALQRHAVPPLLARNGLAVAIRRKDGSEFLACSGQGIAPAIWTLSQRKAATAHKRDLTEHGFDCRVVRVLFADPKVVS